MAAPMTARPLSTTGETGAFIPDIANTILQKVAPFTAAPDPGIESGTAMSWLVRMVRRRRWIA